MLGGWPSITYLTLSSACSLGCFAHPYLGFWLIQHMCCYGVEDDFDSKQFQPTVSYTGSNLWNLLNFSELYHIEHHDFPEISWANLPKIAKIAPEFYNYKTNILPSEKKAETDTATKKESEKQSDGYIRSSYFSRGPGCVEQELRYCDSVIGVIYLFLSITSEEWMLRFGDFGGRERFIRRLNVGYQSVTSYYSS